MFSNRKTWGNTFCSLLITLDYRTTIFEKGTKMCVCDKSSHVKGPFTQWKMLSTSNETFQNQK